MQQNRRAGDLGLPRPSSFHTHPSVFYVLINRVRYILWETHKSSDLFCFQIPSPYSSKRLNLVKQLERTKKMEAEPWVSEDTGRSRETSKENEGDKSFTVTMP